MSDNELQVSQSTTVSVIENFTREQELFSTIVGHELLMIQSFMDRVKRKYVSGEITVDVRFFAGSEELPQERIVEAKIAQIEVDGYGVVIVRPDNVASVLLLLQEIETCGNQGMIN